MIHVYPVNDIEEHDLYSTTCHCRPRVSFENGEMIVFHNSFDGREIIEEVNKILGYESHR
jgi:hypothetical protein